MSSLPTNPQYRADLTKRLPFLSAYAPPPLSSPMGMGEEIQPNEGRFTFVSQAHFCCKMVGTMEQVTVQHDTFKEGLAALESLLDDEFFQILRETQEEGREAVEAAPITEKYRIFYENLWRWKDRLSTLIKKAFEQYTAVALGNSRFVEGEPIEWVEDQVRQFLEPRLGRPMRPTNEGASFTEQVTGGQKAHKYVTYWVAEVSAGEGYDLTVYVDGQSELDEEALDSWQAPAWLAHGFLQKKPLEGRLDAKTTAPEVGVIHFELWIKFEEAIEHAIRRATVDIAASTDLALKQLEIAEHKRDKEKGEKPIFPSPPGLRWEKDVTIAFISDNEIRVEAKGLAEQYTYDEIGFGDKRSGGRGKLWLVFRSLAMLGGSATVDQLAHASKGKEKVPKDIQRLRTILYKLMGIKGDPFYDFKKWGRYRTKFALLDEHLFGDHKKR